MIGEIRKALVAALTGFLGPLVLALDDGGVSAQEWAKIALATVVALGAVWAVPNDPPKL
jgi:hypothetical protein